MRRIKAVTSHAFLALLEGALVATLMVGLVAGTAFAAKPSGGGGGKPGGGGGTLSLVLVVDVNGNGSPNWGDTVTFDVSTTATTQPHVSLTCSQGGTVVYGAAAGFYDSYPWPYAKIMTLSSAAWTGGAADCTAKLYYFGGTKTITLATLSFQAGA